MEWDIVECVPRLCDENSHTLACDQDQPWENSLEHLAYLFILLSALLFLMATPHLPIFTPENPELTSSLLVSWFPKREGMETIVRAPEVAFLEQDGSGREREPDLEVLRVWSEKLGCWGQERTFIHYWNLSSGSPGDLVPWEEWRPGGLCGGQGVLVRL